MPRIAAAVSLFCMTALNLPAAAQSGEPTDAARADHARHCGGWVAEQGARNPTERELRCIFGVSGPGRFGLLWYLDVPAYQPATPLPGTHVVGIAGMPHPAPDESYEAWEWRLLRREFGPEVRQAQRGLDLLDPIFAGRLMELEARLHAEGIRAHRRETWRSPERQAFVFQQGRSRPGPLATATLTSWHSVVDSRGQPAGLAADYTVPHAQLRRFHELVEEVRLQSFGADSNDPGHVYLPRPRGVTPVELAMLRLLPRVPVVTLATGRPFDEPTPPALRAEWRDRSLAFAREPFIPFAPADVRPTPPGLPRLRAAIELPEPPASRRR